MGPTPARAPTRAPQPPRAPRAPAGELGSSQRRTPYMYGNGCFDPELRGAIRKLSGIEPRKLSVNIPVYRLVQDLLLGYHGRAAATLTTTIGQRRTRGRSTRAHR